MFKFFKWFFGQKDESKLDVTRKLKGYRDPKSAPPIDPAIVKEVLADVMKYCDNDIKDIDDLQRSIIVPLDITPEVIDHILRVSGFQKSVVTPNGIEYDPRLISLINLTLNIYYSGVAKRITKTVDLLAVRS